MIKTVPKSPEAFTLKPSREMEDRSLDNTKVYLFTSFKEFFLTLPV